MKDIPKNQRRRMTLKRAKKPGAETNPLRDTDPVRRPVTLPRLKWMGDETSDMEYRRG